MARGKYSITQGISHQKHSEANQWIGTMRGKACSACAMEDSYDELKALAPCCPSQH
jgi:predicted  nucleic acid-binding Zn-ribbon protein